MFKSKMKIKQNSVKIKKYQKFNSIYIQEKSSWHLIISNYAKFNPSVHEIRTEYQII